MNYEEIKEKRRNSKHGMSKHPTYQNYRDMLRRCFEVTNKRYKDYAERGISVHADFVDSFEKFAEEMGDKPDSLQKWSIGRIDNNAWYTYENIQWETNEQQARNHSKQANNTSGITGVKKSTKVIAGRTYTAWVASWNTLEGNRITKNFSIDKFGDEGAKKLAKEFRDERIKELNALGAGYADTHGSDK